MSGNPDIDSSNNLAKEAKRVHRALDGGIDRALQDNGYELEGLSFKINPGDVLCTVRLSDHTGPLVSFVGSTSVVKCVLKLLNEARGGELRTREDRYRR